ncbi:MAG: hypothetical protein WBF90_38760 [Rivularia sp. (in: cyanobacteria)]
MNEFSAGNNYQQLELPLNIPTLPEISGTYDITWDNFDTQVPPHAPKCVREQVTFDAESSNIDLSPQSPSQNSKPEKTDSIQVAPEHSSCVREQLIDKSAPEHKQLGIQWVEEYWVKRSGKRHYYYRFCWMDGRKIRHKHIGGGNSSNPTATYRKLIVEMSLGTKSTKEMIALIDSFK